MFLSFCLLADGQFTAPVGGRTDRQTLRGNLHVQHSYNPVGQAAHLNFMNPVGVHQNRRFYRHVRRKLRDCAVVVNDGGRNIFPLVEENTGNHFNRLLSGRNEPVACVARSVQNLGDFSAHTLAVARVRIEVVAFLAAHVDGDVRRAV